MRVPLSFAQERLWFLQQLDPGGTQYNLPTALRFTGALQLDALRAALDTVVARHDVLRTTFPARDGQPHQVVGPAVPVAMPVTDVSASRVPMLDAERLVAADAAIPFDLSAGPPLRARLIRLGTDEHVLSLVLHHIVCDERSMQLLREELTLTYTARRDGGGPPLAPLPIQYADYATWQRTRLTTERRRDLLEYWRAALDGAPTLDLAPDRSRAPSPDQAGATVEFDVAPDVRDALRALSHANRTTPFTTLLAAFSLVLGRCTGHDDILLGTSVSERGLPDADRLVGCFLNTLVLRTDLSGNPSFAELLRRARGTTLDGFAHQDLPFEQLVDEIGAPRDPARHPFFQVAFAYANATGDADMSLPEVRYCAFPIPPTPARFDLTLTVTDAPGRMHGAVEYDPRLFDRATVERLADHLDMVLRQVATEPDRRIGELTSPPAVERRILARWGAAAAPVPGGPVHERIRQRAAEAPDAVAVIAGDDRLTYRDLLARADRVATALRKHGAGAETVVGLHLDRGIDLVTTILAVWRAGGAYLALDVGDPAARNAQLLRDARAALMVTRGSVPPAPAFGADRLDLDEVIDDALWPGVEPAPVDPRTAAYVVYTSGSTGQPKGVVVSHGALNNLAEAQRRGFGIDRDDRVLQFASCGFDAFVSELAVTLSAGATLVVASELARVDPAALVRECEAAAVTVATLPPALLAVLDRPLPAGLRTLVSAGERLAAGTARRWASGRRLLNAYGPAEATVCATLAEVTGAEPGGPPIGRPLVNMRCVVLDEHGRCAPIGAPGELLLGGAGIARGYAGHADLTAERFVADPFAADGSRLYRTGDLARWGADGQLQYLGRADRQTSIRGTRVEPGEVEVALATHPHIRAAVVDGRAAPDGEQRLVAWIVVDDATAPPATGELRRHLLGRLPTSMIPDAFITVDALPLTSTGKVDRAALPDPPTGLAGPTEPPATATERAVATIWADVLGIAGIGRDDDFFGAGGHSLRAVQATARVRAVLGADVSVLTLFQHPTLAAFAAQVDAAAPAADDEHIAVADRSRPLPLSFAQQRLWFLHQLEPASPEHTVSVALRLHGPLDRTALHEALDALVDRHEVLRTTFRQLGETVEQVVHPNRRLPVAATDLTATPDAPTRITELLDEECHRPFDLSTGMPIRARLFRLADDEHVVALVVHHVVADEQSVATLVDDLLGAYDARRLGRPPQWPPLPVQYADYAVWQRRRFSDTRLRGQLAYWRERLAGIAPLRLPVDRTRPAVRDPSGGWVEFDIPAAVADSLRRLAREQDATPFVVLLAVFQTLLSRYGDQDDVVVGVPVTGRHRAEIERVLGPFLNLLALRTDLSGNPTVRQLVDRVRDTTLAAYAHQDLPFERLVDELAPPRDRGRHPLFQVVFNYTAADGDSRPRTCGALAVQPFSPPSTAAKFDLRLVVDDHSTGMRAALQYRNDLFDAATAERLARHLCALLAHAATEPERPVRRLSMLSAQEAAAETGSAPAKPPEVDAPDLVDLVARHAAEHPNRPAATDGCRSVDYAGLNEAADRLARHLRALGAGTDTVVVLALPSTVDLAIAVLGVWRAGAAFLAVDPSDPLERVRRKLVQTRAALVVSTADLVDDLPALVVPYVLLDDLPSADATTPIGTPHGAYAPAGPPGSRRDRLAYLVHTSGSTGVPKPVAVTHRGLSGYGHSLHDRLAPQRFGVWGMLSPLSVDLGLTALVMAWTTAGTVHLLDPELSRNPKALATALTEHPVDYLKLTPTQLDLLLSTPDAAAALPRQGIVLGGEPLPARLPSTLAALGYTGTLHNHYGPSEHTIGAVVHHVSVAAPSGHVSAPPVPLGTALPSVICRVLDRYGEPVPVGVPGELYLGGAGVARGYLHLPADTAERFVADPFRTDGARLYRTGDLVRREKSGALTFLGRVDDQLNLHGLRIEPGEVEAAVAGHPGVTAAAVHLRPDAAGIPRLVCWIVPCDPDAAPPAADLRTHLAGRLPGPLVPTLFAVVDTLPLTASGKVDRRALPDPIPTTASSRDDPPATDTECVLAQIWSELLGVATIYRGSHFFDLGGHSLLAIRAVSRIRDAFGVDLPLATIFDQPTLVAVAGVVDTLSWIAAGAEPSASDEVEEMTL